MSPDELQVFAQAIAPAAPLMDASEDLTPVSVPRDDVDWDEFEQDVNDPITDKSWCVWTYYGQSKQQYKSNKRFEGLIRLHKENYGKIAPFKFVYMMQDYYNENIRSFLMKPDPQNRRAMIRWTGPAWPACNIWNFSITSVVIPSAIREDVARTLMQAMVRMADGQLFERYAKHRVRGMSLFERHTGTRIDT
jgi:hypothetical protein